MLKRELMDKLVAWEAELRETISGQASMPAPSLHRSACHDVCLSFGCRAMIRPSKITFQRLHSSVQHDSVKKHARQHAVAATLSRLTLHNHPSSSLVLHPFHCSACILWQVSISDPPADLSAYRA